MSTDNDLLTLCRNIRYLRQKHKLTKAQMAEILGISKYSLSLLEKDICPPRLEYTMLITASRYFKIPIYWLFLPLEK